MDEPVPQLTRATPDPVGETPPATARAPRVARMAKAIALDLSPLRTSRDFRLLFIGQGVSFAGTMITYVAVPFAVFQLTHSSLAVGLLSAVELIPILLIALISGAMADAFDRRRMVRLTELGMCAVSSALVVNAALPRPQLWVLFVAAGLAAGIDALQRPSLDALAPRLVNRDQIPAAAALEALRGNVGHVIGPPIAGLLIATAGLPVTFGIDVATFGVSLTALSLMRPVPRADDAPRVTLASVFDGLRYAWRRQDLLGTYAVDMNAMFFGMPIALFPQIATQFGGPAALGLLYAAPAAGALLASVSSGWIRLVRRHGRAIAFAAATWGAAIIWFGFAGSLWVALIALAIAGAADMISGLFRMTVWNQTIPDAMRGRLAGIEMISYTSGPALGNLEAGIVASLAGVRASVVSGGVLCVVGTAAIAGLMRRFWRYSAPDGVGELSPPR